MDEHDSSSDGVWKTTLLEPRVVWTSSDVNPAASLEANATINAQPVFFQLQCTNLPVAVLVDFGREIHGNICLQIGNVVGNERPNLRIRLGESIAETMSRPFVQELMAVTGHGTYQTLRKTGFRFVRIDLNEANTSVDLVAVQAAFRRRDLKSVGSFNCSDERLNQIWEVGADTTELCMQTQLWDGIKRGRRVWVGDLYPAAMVVGAVFGAQQIVEQSLDLIRDESIDESGKISWMNEISGYSLYWILIQKRWYLQHGNLSYLQTQAAYLADLVQLLESNIDDDGHESLDGWRFLDWATSDNAEAVHEAYQGLFVLAIRAAFDLCTLLDESTLRDHCERILRRLSRQILHKSGSKQSAAFMSLAGLVDAGRANRETFSVEPTRGITPFLGFTILQARAQAGDIEGCHDLLRDYWGAMLDLGATTFWEDFDIDWLPQMVPIDQLSGGQSANGKDANEEDAAKVTCGRFHRGASLSLCHAWSAGPTAWLSEHALGIRPLEPGCRVLLIHPQLGGLSWAQGTYPTPLGVVRVRHDKTSDGTVKSDFDIPKGIRVVSSAEPSSLQS